MAGFTRRYTYFPDAATIRQIEGVIIVDQPVAAPIQSSDSGSVVCVGEYEDGGFMTDPATPVDAYHPAGGLIETSNDSWASTVGTLGFTFNGLKNAFACARIGGGEKWNGNAYVHCKGLRFRRFFCARVDTSVGSVTLSPLAFQESAVAGPFNLAAAQNLVLAINGAANVTATFNATAAVVTGAAAVFTSLTSGQYVDLAFDGGATVRTIFQTGDTTIAAVVARINGTFGATLASSAAGQLALTSSVLGTSSKVNVVAASAGTLANLGIAAGLVSGTGNVANVTAVTAAEVQAIVQALVGAPKVRITAKGTIRIASPTGITGTLQVVSATATAFGFVTGVTATASSGTVTTSLPAGTVCSASATGAASRVVTMQTLPVPANTAIGLTVKVRPAVDDGTFVGYAAAAIDTIETVVSGTSEWTVTNAALLTAALTDAQKDVAYGAAIALTKAISGPARKLNYIVSARQSHQIRLTLLQNALDSSGVSYGRKAIVAPPLGTSLATMQGATSPGVTLYRNERLCYVPGWRKYVSEIAGVGAALGGTGFTDTGNIEVHGDIVAASVMSIMPPWENPAQTTDIIPREYIGVESALQTWGITEYSGARASGIMAPIFDENEGPQLMSGVTSVDPTQLPGAVPVTRIRLADALTDSVSEFEKGYVKKLGTDERKALLLGKIEEYLQGHKDLGNIADFRTSEGKAPGRRMHVVNWAVEPQDSMDAIINQTQIGEGSIKTVRLAA